MFRPDEFTPERPSTIFNNIWGTVKRHEKILDQDISFSTRLTVMFVQRSVKDLIFSWSYRKSQKCFWYLKSYFSPQKWRMTAAVGRGWEVWQWRKVYSFIQETSVLFIMLRGGTFAICCFWNQVKMHLCIILR